MSVAPIGDVFKSHRAEREAMAAAVRDEVPQFDPPAEGVLRSVDGEVLHASRSRPVVRWVVTDRSAGRTHQFSVIGKVYYKGGGAAAHDLLSHLRRSGFGGAYDVPAALGYIARRKMLLQSEAPPATLYEGLGALDSSAHGVYRAGEWLARLHAVTGTNLRPLAAEFEASKAEQYISALAPVKPHLARQLRNIQAELMPRLAAATAGPLVATHGDFQPKNVHLDAERVVVIDFDRAALAPAARDLGHFVGQALTMAAAAGNAFDGPARDWACALFDGYTAGGGSVEAIEATPAYVARTFLEVLFYRLVVRPMRDDSFAAAWVAECAEWLERSAAVVPT